MTNDTLRNFLANGLNSVSRERMYVHRTHFDLQLAAARRGYALSIFEPEVDREGFDIVLDDADQTRRFQLKSALSDTGTNSWPVWKQILRPSWQRGDQLLLPYPVRGSGGGVIIQIIEYIDEAKPITYRYCDFDILHAIAHEYLQADPELCAQAQEFLALLLNGVGSDKIALSKALTFAVRDAASLLAIAGFHSPIDVYLPFENYYLAEADGFSVAMQPPYTDQHIHNAARIEHSGREIVNLLSDNRLNVRHRIPKK